MFGFTGKTLTINLKAKTFQVVTNDEAFYRKFLGGATLATKLFEEFSGKTNNPFSEDNPIIFSTGPLAGGVVCGATRVNVLSLSPETKGIYVSQAGGEFGPDMKRAGFDAIVITGKSKEPVYLKITNTGVKFIKAGNLWGKGRLETYQVLLETTDDKYSIASIGPAGEKLVCHANIMFEPDHYAGRGGLGAVMGSKNLKAICITGDNQISFKDKEKIKEINKKGIDAFAKADPNSFLGILKNLGTFGLLAVNEEAGNLPTRNFKFAHIEPEKFNKQMSHAAAKEYFVGRLKPCKGCYIACKKHSKANPEYTCNAEYESIALLGPNIGLTEDITDGMLACELCGELGIDTMSTGTMISWLMDCFENKVLDENKLKFSIKFGEGKKACELIENIAFRKGYLGNLLASGIETAVKELGEQTRPYLRFSRGIGIPAHMPRKKPAVGFGYLHGPNPADHMKLEHDWIASDPGMLKAFNLNISSPREALDKNKVEIARITQIYYSAMDALSLCLFVFGPGNIYSFDEITEMVNAATGFNYTFKELMEVGERGIQLQKKIYCELGGTDEDFLSYLETPIPEGPSKGAKISKKDFEETRAYYYKLWNWDSTGKPTEEILEKLGILN